MSVVASSGCDFVMGPPVRSTSRGNCSGRCSSRYGSRRSFSVGGFESRRPRQMSLDEVWFVRPQTYTGTMQAAVATPNIHADGHPERTGAKT
jgi:hypothetical protein